MGGKTADQAYFNSRHEESISESLGQLDILNNDSIDDLNQREGHPPPQRQSEYGGYQDRL